MGTSGSSRGPGSGTPLVPTWLDEPTSSPIPGNSDDATSGDDGEQDSDSLNNQAPSQQGNDAPRPTIPLPPVAIRFQSARNNFSRFSKSGGSDGGALRRAVRDYVRSGTRGSRNATRRMGSSRATASGALGIFGGFQHDGVENTLRRLNLNNLVGRSTEEILVGLTDTICLDGGSIDEAIARDAWLETITELDSFGIGDLDALTTDQVQEVFLSFIAHAIETRLFQDIGINGLHMAASISAIANFEAQFRSYIRRAVRDSFSSDMAHLPTLSDKNINDIVDQTYREAWELLETWGDIEE